MLKEPYWESRSVYYGMIQHTKVLFYNQKESFPGKCRSPQ